MKRPYARLKKGDFTRIIDFDVKGICEDKDKVIKVGEIVKVMDDGYYGCYDVISIKDHIKATTICLEKYIKEPDV